MPKIDFNIKTLINYAVQLVCFGIAILLGLFVIWPQYSDYKNNLPTLISKQARSDQLSAFVTYLQNLSDFEEKLFANMGLAKQAIPETEEAPFFLDQIIQIANESVVSVEALTFGGLSGSRGASTPGSDGTFIRFQAEAGDNLEDISATPQVDEFLEDTGFVSGEDPLASLPASIPAEEFYVSVEFFGTYETITDFLVRLESARRLIEVRDIDFSAYSSSGTSSVQEGQVDPIVAYESSLASSGLSSGELYKVTLLLTGFYMKDPEVGVVGPELLSRQKNLEKSIQELEALTYYEPQSIEEIELNIGRLNPFDEEAIQEEVEADAAADEEDTSIIAVP